MKLLGIGVFLLSLTSCGGQTGPKLPPKKPCIKVTGKVLVDGEPAEGVQVILHPTDEGHGLYQFPTAVTSADGGFKLKTYVNEDGAPKGNYSAVFIWPIPIDKQIDDDDRLKRLYRDPLKSQYKVTIDGTQVTLDPFDLKLKGLDGIPLTKDELKQLERRRNMQKVAKPN
jgi:hypothetical protein